MGPTSPLLRRSENLARALDGAEAPSRDNIALVAIAAALAQTPDPVIDRRFARALERRLTGAPGLRVVADAPTVPGRVRGIRLAVAGFAAAASLVAVAAIVLDGAGPPADHAVPAPTRPAPEIEHPGAQPVGPRSVGRVPPARDRTVDRPGPGTVEPPRPDRQPPVDDAPPPPPPRDPPLFEATRHAFAHPVEIASL